MLILPPGVERISVPMPGHLQNVNYYLLHQSADAYLVDTGLHAPTALAELEQALGRHGVRPGDLKAVILTHSHRDHSGLAPDLRSRWNVPVWMHQAEADYLRQWRGNDRLPAEMGRWLAVQGLPEPQVLSLVTAMASRTSRQVPLQPDALLADGQTVRVGQDQWHVLLTPGHTPGHICLWSPERRLVLTGDHLLPNDTPNVSAFPELVPDPLGAYLQGLERVAALPVDLALPGHGEPFAEIGQRVREGLDHHDARLEHVRRALADGREATGYQVACAIPWVSGRKQFDDLDPLERHLALGEAVAHLWCLAGRGEVRSEEDAEGLVRYRLGQ